MGGSRRAEKRNFEVGAGHSGLAPCYPLTTPRPPLPPPSSGQSVSAHLNISQPSTRPTYNTNRPVWGNKWLRVAEHDSFNNPVNANEAQLSPGCALPKAEETLLAISRVLLANIHSLPASSSLSSGRRCVFLRRGQVFQVGLYYKDSDKDRLAPPGTSVLLCLLAFGFVFLM